MQQATSWGRKGGRERGRESLGLLGMPLSMQLVKGQSPGRLINSRESCMQQETVDVRGNKTQWLSWSVTEWTKCLSVRSESADT